LHLSIFYEYQQFFQHRICFSIQPPDYSDPWPRLAHSTSFFLIMLFNYQKGDGVQNNISLCFLHNVPLYGVLMGHKTLFGNRVWKETKNNIIRKKLVECANLGHGSL
jgi:hypothetical protein